MKYWMNNCIYYNEYLTEIIMRAKAIGYYDGLELIDDIQQRANGCALEVLNFAKIIDSNQMLLLTIYLNKIQPNIEITVTESCNIVCYCKWNNTVSIMIIAAKYARVVATKVVLEFLNRYKAYLINRLEQALPFLEELNAPFVYIQFDAFHIHIKEVETWIVIRKEVGLPFSLHLSNFNFIVLNKSNLDFRTIMSVLCNIKFDGIPTLEFQFYVQTKELLC